MHLRMQVLAGWMTKARFGRLSPSPVDPLRASISLFVAARRLASCIASCIHRAVTDGSEVVCAKERLGSPIVVSI